MWRILIVGPTSQPLSGLAVDIESDLNRLARAGIELSYHCCGRGARSIRTSKDADEAAPFVVEAARQAYDDGFDAVIVDCTEDPGVNAARELLPIPVIGPGETLQLAAASAAEPVAFLSGDQLRDRDFEGLVQQVRHARTVVLGGTGFSATGDRLKDRFVDLVVLDPLVVALDACLLQLDQAP